MAKVVAYCALHYGLPYMEWSIRSVIDYVDQFYVLYSPHGSHNGNPGTLSPIDSEADLQAAAQRGAGDKLVWIRGDNWSIEGQQRDSIHQYAPDADAILVVDSDEVWAWGLADYARLFLSRWPDSVERVSRIRLPIIHYWRSFYRAVLHDPAFPERIIFPKNPPGAATYISRKVTEANDPRITIPVAINHFGYALPPAYIAYKWGGIHGHQAELRKDVDWFANKFMANAQTDTHPVGSEYWNPERVDPLDYMPRWMQDHPYYHMQVIE